MRTLLHTAVLAFGLLFASVAAADSVDSMHPGLNGFRPGVGNELDSRWEPLVRQRNENAYYNGLSPQWGYYDERGPGFDRSECRESFMGDSDSPVRFGYTECGDGRNDDRFAPEPPGLGGY